jgi:hypothetical protein
MVGISDCDWCPSNGEHYQVTASDTEDMYTATLDIFGIAKIIAQMLTLLDGNSYSNKRSPQQEFVSLRQQNCHVIYLRPWL